MNFLFRLCVMISFSIMIGVSMGVFTKVIKKRTYTDKQKEKGQKIWKTGSQIMTYFTFLLLALGLIWCVYFLILGAMDPTQAGYANNMSEMITSVLTIVSIAFAFYEFIRRGK